MPRPNSALIAMLALGLACESAATVPLFSHTVDAGGPPLDAGSAPDSGPPAAPPIFCAPLALDFGTVTVGLTGTLPVICSSTGAAPWDIALLRTSSSVFSVEIDPLTPSMANPGQSLQIDVSYAPTQTSIDTGTLSLSSSFAGAPVVIALTGEGYLEPAKCYFSISPSSVDFGTVRPGTTTTSGFTISNTGPGDCTVSVALTPSTDPAFVLMGGPILSAILSPATRLPVSIEFSPPQTGEYSGAVTLDPSNPSAGGIPLSGVGGSPCFIIRPQNLEFGTDGFGTSGKPCANGIKKFVGVNGCAAAVTIQSVTLNQDDGVFSLVAPQAPQTVAAGQSSTPFEVDFIPLDAGIYYGSAVVQTDLQPEPFGVFFKGSAVKGNTQIDSFTFAGSYDFVLSGTPDQTGIVVSLNGSALLQTEWSFDSTTNSVTIDSAQLTLTAGDQVVISYPLACS